MCRALEVVLDPACHKKPKDQTLISDSEARPAAREHAVDRIRNLHSAISACVGVTFTEVDVLWLLVTATLLFLVCSLITLGGHASSGLIEVLMEVCPLIAEDLGALALLFLLCLIASQLQCRMHASSRNRRSRIEDEDDDLGLDVGCSPHKRRTSSVRKAHRRHSLQLALDQLSDVVRSVNAGSSEDPAEQFLSPYGGKINAAPCGLYNFHTKSSHSLLLPVEVAACQYPPGVSEHLRQLLEDRWTVATTGGVSLSLASIPE